MSQAIEPFLHGSAHHAKLHQTPPTVRPQPAVGQVIRDALDQSQPFLLTIFAQHSHALLDAATRGGSRIRTQIRDNYRLAASDRVESEDGTQHLGSPRAYDPGDAEDFAPMQFQTDATWQLP